MGKDRIVVKPEEVVLQGRVVDELAGSAQRSVFGLFSDVPFAASGSKGFATSVQVLSTVESTQKAVGSILGDLSACGHEIVLYAQSIAAGDEGAGEVISLVLNVLQDIALPPGGKS